MTMNKLDKALGILQYWSELAVHEYACSKDEEKEARLEISDAVKTIREYCEDKHDIAHLWSLYLDRYRGR